MKDKDHWISLDANTKRSHAEAGTGGLALVRALSMRCWIHEISSSKKSSMQSV